MEIVAFLHELFDGSCTTDWVNRYRMKREASTVLMRRGSWSLIGFDGEHLITHRDTNAPFYSNSDSTFS